MPRTHRGKRALAFYEVLAKPVYKYWRPPSNTADKIVKHRLRDFFHLVDREESQRHILEVVEVLEVAVDQLAAADLGLELNESLRFVVAFDPTLRQHVVERLNRRCPKGFAVQPPQIPEIVRNRRHEEDRLRAQSRRFAETESA